jgi:hypothetical protein
LVWSLALSSDAGPFVLKAVGGYPWAVIDADQCDRYRQALKAAKSIGISSCSSVGPASQLSNSKGNTDAV